MLITDESTLRRFAEVHRLWQGIPSVECTKNGRIFVAFYSGGRSEGQGNYCLLVKSDDGGRTWSAPLAVALEGDTARAYDPALWIDPLGRLWFFWSVSPDYCVKTALCDDPDAPTPTFSDERSVVYDVMLNKPIVTAAGDWLFPAAVWEPSLVPPASFGAGPTPHPTGAHVFVTRDAGKSFSLLGSALGERRSYDEHMLLEHPDGTLSMYTRTLYGIGLSHSTDGGRSWSPIVDSGIPNPCSRFHIRRLPSGRVLLVAHHNFTGRNNLSAFLSEDGGETFPHVLLLDERAQVSYPDAAVTQDGRIHIVYDRERGARYSPSVDYTDSAREILLATVTEEDILAGRILHPESALRVPVSALGRRDTQKP